MLETIKQKRLQKKAEPKEELNKFNAVSKKSNFLLNVLFAILAFLAIMPFVFVIAISLTNEQSLQLNGYRFIPEEWSLEAYKYIFSSGSQILTSYGVTITVTILGTLIGLAIMSMYGYALSRKSFAYRKFFTKVIFVPMLFSGGMVASYLVVTRFLGLKNTIWALILPMCVSSFHIIILRTFFKTSVPDAIIESAKIDGASEWRLFLRIVLPISLPGIATIGLFLTLGYWNDWTNGLYYIRDTKLYGIQNLLNKMISDLTALTQNASGASTVAIADIPSASVRMAIAFVAMLPILCLYPFLQKYFTKGIALGAVKG